MLSLTGCFAAGIPRSGSISRKTNLLSLHHGNFHDPDGLRRLDIGYPEGVREFDYTHYTHPSHLQFFSEFGTYTKIMPQIYPFQLNPKLYTVER